MPLRGNGRSGAVIEPYHGTPLHWRCLHSNPAFGECRGTVPDAPVLVARDEELVRRNRGPRQYMRGVVHVGERRQRMPVKMHARATTAMTPLDSLLGNALRRCARRGC